MLGQRDGAQKQLVLTHRIGYQGRQCNLIPLMKDTHANYDEFIIVTSVV